MVRNIQQEKHTRTPVKILTLNRAIILNEEVLQLKRFLHMALELTREQMRRRMRQRTNTRGLRKALIGQ